ncbi:MAG: phosphate ABC transporter substrate-binding protein PstS [Acidimicrobiales bacterium]
MNRKRPSRRVRGLSRTAALAAFALLGSVGLAAVAAAPSGASAKGHAVGKADTSQKSKPTTTASLASLEKTLQGYVSGAPSGQTLSESGSTLMYPLWEEWQAPSKVASGLPTPPVAISPAATGSGTGISEAVSGAVNIGASDAFLSGTELTGPPAMLNIPEVISAQVLIYNLPSLANKHLKLTPTIVNDLYNGAITNWDNKLIAKANPGVTLPNQKVIPVRRSDGSGDTFLITSYVWYGDKTSWNHAAPYYGPQTAYAEWPTVAGELAEKGTTGIISGVNSNVGAIGYVGVSYLAETNADHLGYAALENGTGHFEIPDAATVAAEVSSFTHFPTSGAINLIYSKVASAKFGYPDVNFEYAIVQKNQPNSTDLAAVKALLAWGMDPKDGASSGFLGPIDFKPMPASAIAGAIGLLKELT